MSPVLPQQVKELIINPSDDPCVAFKKFLHAMYLLYLWIRYQNSETEGLIADAFAADLCGFECV